MLLAFVVQIAISPRARPIERLVKTSDRQLPRTFSTNAKNVKIITNEGTVTLRGPVKSDKEKAEIEAKAKRVAGVKKVDNQLEIAS